MCGLAVGGTLEVRLLIAGIMRLGSGRDMGCAASDNRYSAAWQWEGRGKCGYQ